MQRISIEQLASGNTTFWLVPEQRKGYLCAVEKHGVVLLPNGEGVFSRQQVIDWVCDVLNGDVEGASTIGSWIDEGKLYLDVCKWYPDKYEALTAGHREHQLAIWDIENEVALEVTA